MSAADIIGYARQRAERGDFRGAVAALSLVSKLLRLDEA